MILTIDAIGLLTVGALAHQGYKEALGIRKSFLLPALCSVLIFYKTFPLIYGFISSTIPSTILAGIMTIALTNFILITLFYKIFVHFLNKFEERFFLPEISLHLRQTIGVFIGILTGYIFIAGVIESLDHSLTKITARKNSILSKSIFYQVSHKEKKVDQANKIDNLPALKELYSEETVAYFNFSEDELIATLKMIRAISNQDAQILLADIKEGKSITSIYASLLESYTSQEYVLPKYVIEAGVLESIRKRVEYKRGKIVRVQEEDLTEVESDVQSEVDS